jgi:CyaY protein
MTTDADLERSFETAAEGELTALVDTLDGLGLDLEAELSMGILTIEFPDGAKYIVNSHRAARQIWMAADRNAWHFDPEYGAPGTRSRWIAKKSNEELRATLAGAISRKIGRAIDLG